MRNLLLAIFLAPVLASAQNTGIWNQDYNQRLPASMDGTDLVIIQKAPYTPGLTAGKPTNQQYLIINKAATLGVTGTGASALTVTGSQTVGDLLEWTAAGNANSSGMSLADVLSIANHTGILDPDQGGLGVDASMEPDGIWVNDTGSPAVIGLANGLVGVVDSLPVPVVSMGDVFDAVGVTGDQDNTTVLFGDGVLRSIPTGGLGADLSSVDDEIETASGTLELSGTGLVNNEGFNLDFETTANTIDVLSVNGADTFDFTDWTLLIGSLDATNLTAVTFTLPGGNDPDLTTERRLSWDDNGDVLRSHDGTNQVAVGRKRNEIVKTVISPNDLADSERDALWIWTNVSGMNFVITGWDAISDTDNTTLNIEEIDNDGANNATVDAVEIATNGTGLFSGTDATITAATVETGHRLVLDFDDADTPGQVHIVIYGYYDANVN